MTTVADACRRAADLIEADPSRRDDLTGVLVEVTDRSIGCLLADVHQAVRAATAVRYPITRVWIDPALWAALSDTDPADVVAMLRAAADASERAYEDGMTLGLALHRYFAAGGSWSEFDHGDVVQRECDRADRWVDAHAD